MVRVIQISVSYATRWDTQTTDLGEKVYQGSEDSVKFIERLTYNEVPLFLRFYK